MSKHLRFGACLVLFLTIAMISSPALQINSSAQTSSKSNHLDKQTLGNVSVSSFWINLSAKIPSPGCWQFNIKDLAKINFTQISCAAGNPVPRWANPSADKLDCSSICWFGDEYAEGSDLFTGMYLSGDGTEQGMQVPEVPSTSYTSDKTGFWTGLTNCYEPTACSNVQNPVLIQSGLGYGAGVSSSKPYIFAEVLGSFANPSDPSYTCNNSYCGITPTGVTGSTGCSNCYVSVGDYIDTSLYACADGVHWCVAAIDYTTGNVILYNSITLAESTSSFSYGWVSFEASGITQVSQLPGMPAGTAASSGLSLWINGANDVSLILGDWFNFNCGGLNGCPNTTPAIPLVGTLATGSCGTVSCDTMSWNDPSLNYLTMSLPYGGSPSSGWFVAGSNVQISATSTHYVCSGAREFEFKFNGWSGSGSGSYSGSNNPATVTMNSAITQSAGYTEYYVYPC